MTRIESVRLHKEHGAVRALGVQVPPRTPGASPCWDWSRAHRSPSRARPKSTGDS
jgi:hypothetical protein